MANTNNKNFNLGSNLQNILLYSSFIFVFLIILSYSLVTYSLDEVKNVILLTIAPLLLIFYLSINLYLLLQKQTPLYANIPKFTLFSFLAYFIIMMLSSFFSDYHWVNMLWMTFQIGYFAMFFCFSGGISNKRDIVNAVVILCSLALFVSMIGLIQYNPFIRAYLLDNIDSADTKGRPFIQILKQMAYSNDIMATFFNRDFFSNYIVIILPISLSLVLASRKLFYMCYGLFTFFICSYCIVLTKSKDTFLAIFISISIFFIIAAFIYAGKEKIKKYKKFILISTCLLLILFSSFVGYFVKEYNNSDRNSQPVMVKKVMDSIRWSFRSREIMWSGAIGIFKDNIFFGGGPGSYRILFPQYRDPSYEDNGIATVTVYSHNEYLDVLSETGLLGLIAFLSFLISVYYILYKILVSDTEKKYKILAAGLGCGLLGTLTSGSFSPNLRWTVCAVPLWALMGIIVGQHNVLLGTKDSAKKIIINNNLRIYEISAVLVLSVIFAFHSFNMGTKWFKTAVLHCEGMMLMGKAENIEDADSEKGALYYEKAIEKYIEGLKYTPIFLTSYYKLAHCYSQLNMTEKALETYKTLESYCPNYSNVDFNIGLVYKKLGNIKEAKKYLLASDKMNNKLNMKLMTASVLIEMKEYVDAEKGLKQTIELSKNPKFYEENKKARSLLVKVYVKTNNTDELEKHLWESVKLYPDKDEFRENLLVLYKRKYGKAEKFYSFLDNEISKDPENLNLLEVLAMYNYNELNKKDEAIKYLSFINEKDPENLFALYYLGEISIASGDIEKAQEYFEQIISIDPNSMWAAKVKEFLKN